MPGIDEKTEYQNTSSIVGPMASAMSKLKSILPSRKPVQQTAPASNIQPASNGTSPVNNTNPLSSLGVQTTNFGGSTRAESFHPGWDIANKINTPIPIFASGKVIDVVNNQQPGSKGFGNYFKIQDSKGNTWRYSHLNDTFVKLGDTVNKGQIGGTMGITGSVYSLSNPNNPEAASHLDLRIQDLYQKYVNPNSLINTAV